MDLVFGTSAERQSRNAGDGFHGTLPDGVGHAVPRGDDTAMCGTRPPFLWDGAFDAGTRSLVVCADCERLAGRRP